MAFIPKTQVGTGRPARGIRGLQRARGHARVYTYICTHIDLTALSFEGEITFSFLDFWKLTLCFFFNARITLNNCFYLCTSKGTCNQIKRRTHSSFSPVSPPRTPRQIANQNLHLNRIFLMYESGQPEGKEVLHSLTICTKLHLKCDTTF